MRMHESRIILFNGVKSKLRQMGIAPKMSLLNQVNSDLEMLALKQADLEKRYRTASKERRALKEKYNNITHYLGIDAGESKLPAQPNRDTKAL